MDNRLWSARLPRSEVTTPAAVTAIFVLCALTTTQEIDGTNISITRQQAEHAERDIVLPFPSVCLSVHHTVGLVSKRMYIIAKRLHHLIRACFLKPKRRYKILRETPSDGVGKLRFSTEIAVYDGNGTR